MEDISKNLKEALDVITKDLINLEDSIPTKTSDLTNDENFISNPSNGIKGQVLTKTVSGEVWDDPIGTIKVDDKSTSAAFVVDFNGGTIQKYDVDSSVSGSFTVQYENLDIPVGTAPTVELQVPVTGDVTTVTLPSNTRVVDMPNTLTGGNFTYHDIVFRAQRDMNDAVKVYANYGYKFNEEIEYLSFTANEDNSSVALIAEGEASTMYPINLIEYSTDKENWQTYTVGNVITLQNAGDTVYLRGENPTFNDGNNITNYNHFTMSGSIAAAGNIMTLFDKKGATRTLSYQRAFGPLFANCSALTTAPELPATTLNGYAYYKMFWRCSNLVNAPVLPAQTLEDHCYYEMFAECESLKSAVIKAKHLNGYRCISNMFSFSPTFNDLTVHFTEWGSDVWDSEGWMSNVASNGTFRCPVSLPIIRGNNYIPTNWTVVNI